MLRRRMPFAEKQQGRMVNMGVQAGLLALGIYGLVSHALWSN